MKTFIVSPHSSIEYVASHVNISTGRAHDDSHGRIATEEGPSEMVPHCVSIPQKSTGLQMARENLAIYEQGDPRSLLEIVTGDETWIQFKPPIRKQDGRV